MGIGWLRVLCLGALGASLAANDYTAEIANGGLRARQETHVVMRSERLLISQTKIRVEYEFLNESPAPVETVVAFPWPGYAWSAGGRHLLARDVGVPGGGGRDQDRPLDRSQGEGRGPGRDSPPGGHGPPHPFLRTL